jgi:3-deoxy-D-manno-octulosonic-acid transferase
MIFYNLLYRFLRFIIIIASPLWNAKTKAWITLRFNKEIFKTAVDEKAMKIWIHASSGEIEYAKGLIRDFKKAHPQSQIFVSYSSLSAPSLFKNIANEVTAFFPLNWDITEDNVKLLNFINPQILIFSRTDFWPNLINQAKRKNIKLAAIAANPKISILSSALLKFTCKSFDFFSCVEEEQVDFLKQVLPHTEVRYIPDTRFDQVFFRLNQNSLVELSSTKKLMTFGSTWPKDEEVLMQVTQKLLDLDFSLVWAPHDIKHAQSLFETLSQQLPEKKIVKLADFNNQSDFDILIVDRIGVLADFYRFSKLSFVGGSFVSKVHSVMEPLCAGNFVIVGPFYQNNPEAIAFKKIKLVKTVSNADEFLAAVQYFEDNKDQIKELKLRTESKQGGSLKTLQAIEEILKF